MFIPKTDHPKAGFDIGTVLRKETTKGTVGIEIEVEGRRLPKGDGTPLPWEYHHDGSLRGEDNAEYVLQRPIEFSQVPEALEKLWAVFKSKGSSLDDSNRTSVHVHLNCQKFHMNRLASFVALYLCVEEILTEYAGDHRVGNLFCLRAKDAPNIVTQLKRFIQNDGRTELSGGLHYAGLNANALHKFGSLEIRTLRGVTEPRQIVEWVSFLERLYVLSESYGDPRDIPALFSYSGPLDFFETLMGEHAVTLRQAVPFDNDRLAQSMYEGIRMAQDICCCRDWGRFKPVDVQDDPFGRSRSAIANKLQSALNPEGAGAQKKPKKSFTIQPGDGLATLQGFAAQYGNPFAQVAPSPYVVSVSEDSEPEPEYDDPEDDF